MADVQVLAPGTLAAPLSYTIPGAQEIIVKALFATFDGTAAGGAFLPCIRIIAPGGKVVGEYVTDASVAAGSSAEVSFAPFLRSGGGSGGSAVPVEGFNVTSSNFSWAGGAPGSTLLSFNPPHASPSSFADRDAADHTKINIHAAGWYRVWGTLAITPAAGLTTSLWLTVNLNDANGAAISGPTVVAFNPPAPGATAAGLLLYFGSVEIDDPLTASGFVLPYVLTAAVVNWNAGAITAFPNVGVTRLFDQA